ncbi:MAG: CoA transferase [Chloroflexi bacterium]|nr:CoA transferase [Chloroflexota bacterium]
MTWWGVGPYCTFLCALMGAECIKIESATRGAESMRRQPRLHEMNVNKLGIALNLKDPRSLGLFKRLVAVSDALVENFSPGVLPRLGLGYAELRRWNPSLVVASLSAHGAAGPESQGKGLAAIFGAAGGASFVTGYHDGPPVELRLSADLASGTAFCFALLSAVYHARAYGQGFYLDGASREVVSACIGEVLLDASVNGRDQGRAGNDSPLMAPHNLYRCQGEGRWIALAVGNQAEWEALCAALGKQEWLRDARFADQLSRWERRAEIDALVEEWTRRQDAAQAVDMLQRCGVPATLCCNAQELLGDPHLWERGLFVHTQDEEGHPYTMTGGPWRFSETPWNVYRRPPTLGEHNQHIFLDILGVDKGLYEDLVRQGAIA